MSKGKSPWDEGRRAWERLNGWHQDAPSASPGHPGHPDSGDGAVAALADIGLVRHLLDQAELVAVRTARRHGKSWAEIATRLGVTRQSAWERWRDLDEADPQPPVVAAPVATGRTRRDRAAILSDAAEEVARDRRRRSTIVVPNVIGRQWDQARRALLELGLVAVGPDPDGPPLGALGWPDGVVTDQSPESGARVPRGSAVALWVERGGGSGVREPRRPKPTPRVGREWQDEPSDEAVG